MGSKIQIPVYHTGVVITGLGMVFVYLDLKIRLPLNFELITESPAWLLIFCPLAGALYAWSLYRNDSHFRESGKLISTFLFSFRFAVVTMLCLLLLSPLVRTVFSEIEKPILVLLQDESESVVQGADSAYMKSEYAGAMNRFAGNLESVFDVRKFSIGDGIAEGWNFGFDGKETDLAAPVSDLMSRYLGRNFGAVVLASDGLYNKGSNPVYSYQGLRVPVYSIGLGDTTVRKDLLISRVNHNKSAFLGNSFPVEITIDARRCQDQTILLSIQKNDLVVVEKEIKVTSDKFNAIVPVFLEAKDKGFLHYTVSVTELAGEVSFKNNRREFFVDVTDTRQQVLLLAAAPHPDIAAIKGILESMPNYSVRTEFIREFSGNLSGYQLVILHQLPSNADPAVRVTESIAKLQIPVWYILGAQTATVPFNALKTGLTISSSGGRTNEVVAIPSADFRLFNMEEDLLNRIGGLPPLTVPFGNYETGGAVYTLFRQKIGAVSTGMPLLFFSQEQGRKAGVLAGEGLWKWKLREQFEAGTSPAVTSMVTKTVQYLLATEKKNPFRIYYKNTYNENEPVLMEGAFYNESGELTNLGEARMTISDEKRNNYPFTFSKTGNAYQLNAGYMAVGNYTFTATLNSGGKNHVETGNFSILGLEAEQSETVADHALLLSLSERTGGKFFLPAQIGQLESLLRDNPELKPVSYEQKRLDEVIHLKWVFALIMSLLAIEWLIRKRSGSY